MSPLESPSTSSLGSQVFVYASDHDYGPAIDSPNTPANAAAPEFPELSSAAPFASPSAGRRTRARAYSLGFAATPTVPLVEDEAEEEEGVELEMDTLNRGSEGRGGWKMLGSGPGGMSRFEPLTMSELIFVAACVAAILTVTSVALLIVATDRQS